MAEQRIGQQRRVQVPDVRRPVRVEDGGGEQQAAAGPGGGGGGAAERAREAAGRPPHVGSGTIDAAARSGRPEAAGGACAAGPGRAGGAATEGPATGDMFRCRAGLARALRPPPRGRAHVGQCRDRGARGAIPAAAAQARGRWRPGARFAEGTRPGGHPAGSVRTRPCLGRCGRGRGRRRCGCFGNVFETA